MSELVTDVMVNGRWPLTLPKHRVGHWRDNPVWEPERLASMRRNLHPGMVVWDIGAEQGDLSALYATWVRGCTDTTCPCQDGDSCHYEDARLPSGEISEASERPPGWQRGGVVLVEPAPWYWPTIRETFEANHLRPPLGAACGFVSDVADPDRHLVLHGWPDEAKGESTGFQAFQSVIGATTRRTTLDAMAEHLPCDAISMDIEGAEYLAMRGAHRILSELRPLIWISVHAEAMFNDHGVYQAEFHSMLHQHGYEKFLLGFDHELHVFYWPSERADEVAP